ncbi:MAG TPA: hypothetical protein VK814_05575 [Acidobacteriaceae bacterium]|nr:hypothetical protein [Acidobacteriaceae bacterium]
MCLRRPRLQKLFSSFPEGWPGIGLVFLRLTVGVNAMICAIDALVGPTSHTMIVWAIESLAVAVGAAIVVGFLTPVASAAATVAYLLIGGWPSLLRGANNHISALTAFDLAAISGALVFLGPGAFSLDARLFGRREIIIPDGRVQPMDDSQENSTRH